MGNKVVGLDGDHLYVERKAYNFTPGLSALITHTGPQRKEYTDDDYIAYRALVAHTEVKKSPNYAGSIRPHASWKWKHMWEMFKSMESLHGDEESEDTDDSDSKESVDDEPGDDEPGPSVPSPPNTR